MALNRGLGMEGTNVKALLEEGAAAKLDARRGGDVNDEGGFMLVRLRKQYEEKEGIFCSS